MAEDMTPEQQAIQDKREALREIEERSIEKRIDEPAEPGLIFDPAVGKFVPPPRHTHFPLDWAERDGARKPVLRLFLSLVVLAAIGVPIWVVYGFASGSFAILGNCGPQGFIGQDGHWAGGTAASAWTAAVIGGVLWTLAGAAVWRLRQTSVVVLVVIPLYVTTLIVLALVSRPIWGPRHCVM